MLYSEKVTAPFAQKVKAIASRLKTQADWLMLVMHFETAGTFSPSIQNPHTGATGLIQFMPSTASGLGTSTAALAGMDSLSQLDYVEAYFKPYRGRLDSLEDTYLAVFYPAAIGKPDSWEFPAKVAAVNAVFDRNKDGMITKGEVRETILSRAPAGAALGEKKNSGLGC